MKNQNTFYLIIAVAIVLTAIASSLATSALVQNDMSDMMSHCQMMGHDMNSMMDHDMSGMMTSDSTMAIPEGMSQTEHESHHQ
ncbi:hypothetical protein J4219_07310 [Candidatus Woesearchaeota archaeon]|nr:hypothetical protein [Candidatus Woesearchaeota archaeon]